MLEVCGVCFKPGSREELLPNYSDCFPYTGTRFPLQEEGAPWHWHKAVELFYIPQGTLEYRTPSQQYTFQAGFGGFINSNVPHTTTSHQVQPGDLQLLHLFDPVFIAGSSGSRMDTHYVLPLTTASQAEMVVLNPEEPCHAEILELLRQSFQLRPEDRGYELKLRAALSQIWLLLLDAAAPQMGKKTRAVHSSAQLKQMMVFIHEHYSEQLTVKEIAAAASISERLCFYIFKNCLHTTPAEYITRYRLQAACQMLRQTLDSITNIAFACGFGSSSYFCTCFRRETGLSPLEYRAQAQHTQGGSL